MQSSSCQCWSTGAYRLGGSVGHKLQVHAALAREACERRSGPSLIPDTASSPPLGASGLWGYNPRMLFPVHPDMGTPEDLRSLVNACHKRGIAVLFDAVLHHGAARNNSLWAYDGWEEGGNGGIYFEGGGQTGFGTEFAFHKREVREH